MALFGRSGFWIAKSFWKMYIFLQVVVLKCEVLSSYLIGYFLTEVLKASHKFACYTLGNHNCVNMDCETFMWSGSYLRLRDLSEWWSLMIIRELAATQYRTRHQRNWPDSPLPLMSRMSACKSIITFFRVISCICTWKHHNTLSVGATTFSAPFTCARFKWVKKLLQ